MLQLVARRCIDVWSRDRFVILPDLLYYGRDFHSGYGSDGLVCDDVPAKGRARATYTHGNTTLEIIWTIVPAAILIVLSFMSVSTWARVNAGS